MVAQEKNRRLLISEVPAPFPSSAEACGRGGLRFFYGSELPAVGSGESWRRGFRPAAVFDRRPVALLAAAPLSVARRRTSSKCCAASSNCER
jgi:hypothetical protein